MRKLITMIVLSFVLGGIVRAATPPDVMEKNVKSYFGRLVNLLARAAEEDPDVDTFRKVMKPVVEQIDGLYGATLISPDFVIKQVYFPSHFLARGFDLKNVKELKEFYRMMKENPAPQLSEPGHGSVLQPRLIAMRYPVIEDGKLKNIISIMMRTESFLKAVGLDKAKAYKIIVNGKVAEKKGKFKGKYHEIKVKLPSTEWVIQYE